MSLTLNAVDSGWYTSTGVHHPTNDNYIVGNFNAQHYRNFFVFDLSAVVQPIVGAELKVWNPGNGYVSSDPSETYALWDVSTPVSDLIAGGSNLVSIYSDLGTGGSYGARKVTSADNGTVVTVALSTYALDALNSASGSFALGGSLTTLDASIFNSEYFTGSTGGGGSDIRQLVLITSDAQPVPTPAAIGAGLVGFALLALRRGNRGRRGDKEPFVTLQ